MLHFYRFKHFLRCSKLLHLVTTKSNTLPCNFSLALHTGENKEKILQNRHRLAKELQSTKPLHFIMANQTHSDNIHTIKNKDSKGWEDADSAIQNCDALITNVPDIVLGILTADCVPILLYDKQQHVVAAIHAGWRGTKSQIVKKTIEKMQNTFSADPANILAGIAPSIGKCCYEVGEDVLRYFDHIPQSFKKYKDKYMLDLPYINQQHLLESGIKKENIEASDICTACHAGQYFSYRKENGCSGRFMSLIALSEIL